MGTTAIGAVDPLDEIVALREKYGFRIHVDAAYGGYFKLIPEALDEPARRAFAVIDQADSIVVDPHKHGLQPYGCGCVLFRDPARGPLLQARLAVYVFHIQRVTPWRDQPGVLPGRGGGGGAVGNPESVASRTRGEFAPGWQAGGRRARSWTAGSAG